MRKLKLQVQMTIDGFICGTNSEMDWMQFPWTDDIIQYVRELTEPVDTILLGRNLAQGFIPHWENVVKNPNDPEYEGGLKYTKTPKVVFTKTLDESVWDNTVLAKGDIVAEVNALKNENGGDIIVYGGSKFVSSLIQHNLIDEYHLFINPAAIGMGLPIFKEIHQYLHLNLEACQQFDCGIALLKYTPKNK
jgi:dihydrofolate reductase